MAPAPLCKTAIVTFLVDRETLPNLWNLSSNMRKRLQMILEQMEITLREYNEKALKIKEWVRIGRHWEDTRSIQDIKKGVSNYSLDNQEQLDKVLSLNGKLRCYEIDFQPNTHIEVDSISCLTINSDNYDFYSNCLFNKIERLYFDSINCSQIKEITMRVKRINILEIVNSSISALDLTAINPSSVVLSDVNFKGEAKLPFYLDSLCLNNCKNIGFLKCNKVSKIDTEATSKESLDLIKSLRGVKYVDIYGSISKLMNYLPNSVRILGFELDFDLENEEISVFKKKFPFLIKVENSISIETAQILNLKSIKPIMNRTEEKFTLRPREIVASIFNSEELNKHSELFEKVEKVWIKTNEFKYDCLPGQVKQIWFNDLMVNDAFERSLEKNSWKFENSLVDVSRMKDENALKILNCLKRIGKITVKTVSMSPVKEYSQFRFID